MGGGLWQVFFLQIGAKSKVNEASQKRSLEFGPNEPKFLDFSYIFMTSPPIPFWGLKMAKKGVFRAFFLSAVLIFGS